MTVPGPTLARPVGTASPITPLTVNELAALLTPKLTPPGCDVSGEKPGEEVSVIGPCHVLLPPVFKTAPVPSMPVPDSTRFSPTTTTDWPAPGDCTCSWAPSRTMVAPAPWVSVVT